MTESWAQHMQMACGQKLMTLEREPRATQVVDKVTCAAVVGNGHPM